MKLRGLHECERDICMSATWDACSSTSHSNRASEARLSLTSLNWDFGVYIYIYIYIMAKYKEVNACPPPEATKKCKH